MRSLLILSVIIFSCSSPESKYNDISESAIHLKYQGNIDEVTQDSLHLLPKNVVSIDLKLPEPIRTNLYSQILKNIDSNQLDSSSIIEKIYETNYDIKVFDVTYKTKVKIYHFTGLFNDKTYTYIADIIDGSSITNFDIYNVTYNKDYQITTTWDFPDTIALFVRHTSKDTLDQFVFYKTNYW
ncbi:hypothetical protein [Fulvivirga lutea]|uniref:Uncharacterized protein n=1 Tax=Fulvivirga lutea TaxID=2810512 RepID=A0A974WP08_9BACT|nr:hypothetical protein [Fulvivirga lutea]QSE99003.1 hypothetical protein JR347_07930 [Fulvivirga lutea]